MFTYAFFNSYPGIYVTQAFFQSLIASIISDQALRAWEIESPAIRQRFRLIAVVVPVISFPLYQTIDHSRSSLSFRLSALFDANRWMTMDIGGVVPVGMLFLVMLGLTALVFLLQEMLPVVLHTVRSRTMEQEGKLREPDEFLRICSAALSIPPPALFILDDEELIIFSTTGKKPVIFVSYGLIEEMPPDEVQAALAHEIAHIARSRRPVLPLVFLLRMSMFFNPVSLIEFRRVIRNEEKICDDIAVSLTHRPDALKRILRKFVPAPEHRDSGEKKALLTPVHFEQYSHSMQLESRIARLEQDRKDFAGNGWMLFSVTVVIIMGINYFIS